MAAEAAAAKPSHSNPRPMSTSSEDADRGVVKEDRDGEHLMLGRASREHVLSWVVGDRPVAGGGGGR